MLRTRENIKENLGFREIKILSGNVGYLDLRSFEPLELAREKATSAFRFLENTDALIIDLRNNHGGNPSMVQYICSIFFEKPTLLNSIYWRRGDYTENFWSMSNITIDKRPQVPLFILISARTFSGGEEFAYNLQKQKCMGLTEVDMDSKNSKYLYQNSPIRNSDKIFFSACFALRLCSGP